MKTAILLSLALALPMFTSCSQATDAAAAAGDAASAVADKAGDMAEGFKMPDLSNMSMDAVKEQAGSMVGTITESLGGIKDLASAEKFKNMAGPMIEGLGKMKEKLGTALPGMDSLKGALANFKPDGKIAEMLGPILEKLKGLMG